MSTHLRLPALAFACLSVVLNIAILACAARTLHLFHDQQSTNAWFLPIWPNHFDLRGLQTLIGTSVATLVLNAVAVVALLVPSLSATITTLTTSLLTTFLSLLSLILPSVLNSHSPRRDTLQTWTCQWTRTTTFSGQQPPDQFTTICHETRFAFFTTIPVFILQLLLVGTAGLALRASRNTTIKHVDLEGKEHELGQFGERKTPSLDVKVAEHGSPKSTVTESARILPERKA